MRTGWRWSVALALVGLATVGSCAREQAKREARERVFAPPPPPPEQVLAAQPLDVSALARDPVLRDRVVRMSMSEIAQRLGSLHYQGQEQLTFSRGDLKRKQVTSAQVTQARSGSFSVDVDMEGGDQQHLVYHDGVLYVRHNVGRWRTSRDPTDERVRWREQAYGLWPALYDLLRDNLRLSDGTPVTAQGREALRFELVVTPGQAPAEPMPAALRTEDAGLSPLEEARRDAERSELWRRYAVTESGGGSMVVDRQSGVILELELGATLRVDDVPDAPARAEVNLKTTVDQVGQELSVAPPADSVSEFARRKIVTQPLSFLDGGSAPAPAASAEDDEP